MSGRRATSRFAIRTRGKCHVYEVPFTNIEAAEAYFKWRKAWETEKINALHAAQLVGRDNAVPKMRYRDGNCPRCGEPGVTQCTFPDAYPGSTGCVHRLS